jgi:hypothetical protein
MTGNRCACGCCAGVADRTPVRLFNRPGLSEIGYRTGTYAGFRASMIAGLARSDRPALAALRTRDSNDVTLALIDAWAVAGDVLTFYTERIANEHYLGTATERRSVSGIVGLIGYWLGAGVAAQTTLAFTRDTSPGSPTTVPIATGAKVQTLPGPGELPQTYETVEDLTALADWNTLLVRQAEPRVPRDRDQSVLLAGVATGINRGDTLLFVASDPPPTESAAFALAQVTAVAVDAVHQRTAVSFESVSGLGDAPETVHVYAMRQKAALFGYNAPSPLLFVQQVKDALGDQLKANDSEWVFSEFDPEAVDLDGIYDGITVSSPIVLVGATVRLAFIKSVRETSRTAYGISAKVTRLDIDLTLSDQDKFGGDATRSTVVLLRGEELTLADVPVTMPVFGASVELEARIPVPELPRPILVRGRRARVTTGDGTEVLFDDGSSKEAARLKLTALAIVPDTYDPFFLHVRVETDEGLLGTVTTATNHFVFLRARVDDPILGETAMVESIDDSTLVLSTPLINVYDRHTVAARSVEIWGNVATATHGESVLDEVLGSGNAAVPFQRFTLRRKPLTQVQAHAVSGAASTLHVFVNDVAWQEVPTLFRHGPRDRVFTATTSDGGATVVQFGDGINGARPPTGHDNIRARYRHGTGLAGLASAGQLSLLMTRPLGVRDVRNPLPAAGAQDPQLGADAASNAPRTVLTMDRIVSLRDYEDFAANVAGIGKATATWTWDGVVRGVILSVAGVAGASIDPAGPLMANLSAAVCAAGNPRVPVVILPAEPGLFTLEATLVLDPAFVAGPVLDAARTAVLDHFSFARREFGQIVSLGEVDEVLHAVRGVRGVQIVRLHRSRETAFRHPLLRAHSPAPGEPPASVGADVLTINPDQLRLEVAQ